MDHRQSLREAVESEPQPRVAGGRQKKAAEQQKKAEKPRLKKKANERKPKAKDPFEELKLAKQQIASLTQQLASQSLTFQEWVDQEIDTQPMLFTKFSTSTESQKSCLSKNIRKWENFETEVLEHIEKFGKTSTTRQAQDFSGLKNISLKHNGIVNLVGFMVAKMCHYEELVDGCALLSFALRAVEVKWIRKPFVVMKCTRPIWFRDSDTALPSDISLIDWTRCQQAAILELYRYMTTTETGFGVLTSLDVSYFIRRCKNSAGNDYDILEISDGICWNSRRPSFLGAMHYLLMVAKDKMRTSYTSHRQAISTGVPSGIGNEDDKAVSRAHGYFLRSNKRPSRNTFSAMRPRSKRHQARSLALQDFAEEDLNLDRTPFAKGCSGNIVCGKYHGLRIAVKFAPVKSRRQKALQNEAAVYHMLQDLWGKYIPKLVAHGTTAYGDVVFLATEFVYGSKFSDADITPALATEARAALAALHSYGILHGDLHSGNILVIGEGVRFLDFGFSKRDSSRSECEAEMIELEGMIQRYSEF